MDVLKITPLLGDLIFSDRIDNELLEVRELDNYRWFHFSGDAIQSLMDSQQPDRILLPVPQSMLLFLLWKQADISVLNLGMGGAAFERKLVTLPQVQLTSVEKNPQIIAMARKYFALPTHTSVFAQSAEQFLQNQQQQFDVILCDIFAQQKNPECLYQFGFYQNLHKRLKKSGVILINLFPENEENLLKILLVSHRCFDNIALIEFENYQNIVLIISSQAIPNIDDLNLKNQRGDNLASIDFTHIIKRLIHVPKKQR